MNKGELIHAVAKKTGASLEVEKKTLEAFLNIIGDTLKKENVRLLGFGRFYLVNRPARVGRNPKTGDAIKIDKKNVVRFKAGADLQGRVN